MRMILPRTLVALLAVLTIVLTNRVFFSVGCPSYYGAAVAIWYMAPLALIAALVWLVVRSANLFEQVLALGVASLLMVAYVPAALIIALAPGCY